MLYICTLYRAHVFLRIPSVVMPTIYVRGLAKK